MKENDDNLVVFRTFENPIDASIVKGVLETNGVQCMLSNELMSSVLPISSEISAVDLWVNEKDLDMAEKIMKSAPEDYNEKE